MNIRALFLTLLFIFSGALFAQERSSQEVKLNALSGLEQLQKQTQESLQVVENNSFEKQALQQLLKKTEQALEVVASAQEETLDASLIHARDLLSLFLALPQKSRSPDDVDDDASKLSLSEVIALIKEKKLSLYLAQGSLQISVRRIVLRTFSELFYRFGADRLRLEETIRQQHETLQNALDRHKDDGKLSDVLHDFLTAMKNNEPFSLASQAEQTHAHTPRSQNLFLRYLHRAGAATKTILWHERSRFSLRTMKIFAAKYFETLIPNPHAKKWQQFAELLIPVLLANTICFYISNDMSQTAHDLKANIVKETLINLVMVRLFFEKNSAPWWAVNSIALLYSFYFANEATKCWKKISDEGLSPWEKRKRFLQMFWNDSETFHGIAFEGLFDIVFYTILDDFLMPYMKVPRFLKPTSVTPKLEPEPEEGEQ